MAAKKNNNSTIRSVVRFYTFLFVAWGFYRLLFQFPDPLEDLVVKPLIWLAPLYFLLKKEKAGIRSLGFSMNNVFHVIYFVLFLGFLFSLTALIINYLKYGSIVFEANIGQMPLLASLGLSFATAVSEEVAFRGYIYTRAEKFLKSELNANLVTSIGWVAIHLPIAYFDWHLGFTDLIIYLLLIFTYSLGVTFVFARTKNIIAPILLHVLWAWPIILFR